MFGWASSSLPCAAEKQAHPRLASCTSSPLACLQARAQASGVRIRRVLPRHQVLRRIANPAQIGMLSSLVSLTHPRTHTATIAHSNHPPHSTLSGRQNTVSPPSPRPRRVPCRVLDSAPTTPQHERGRTTCKQGVCVRWHGARAGGPPAPGAPQPSWLPSHATAFSPCARSPRHTFNRPKHPS